MTTKICKQCGTPFTAMNNAEAYCSNECRKRAYTQHKKKNPRNFVCKQCGKTFTSQRAKKYCCELCRHKAQGRIKAIYHRVTNKPQKSIAEINAAARAENLTYGQYLAKHGYGE